MGQVRHGSATTTHAVRAAIQRSQASLAQLSKELGINPKTVAKWRKRATVEDLKTGPREPRSTVLTEAEEAMVVAFRRHTLLPLDDCLYALQPSIPRLTRSALHRCLQRHGISRLPEGGTVEIALSVEGHELLLRVRNPAPPPRERDGRGAQHAQANIGQRLRYHYGPRARMTARWEADYYLCELRVPLGGGTRAG